MYSNYNEDDQVAVHVIIGDGKCFTECRCKKTVLTHTQIMGLIKG